MNSRERLLAAIRHEPVDRVPISTHELVGWNPDSWENRQPAYRGLMQLVRDHTDCMYMLGFPMENRAARVTVTEWDDGPRHYRREVLHTPRGDLTALDRSDEGLHTIWRIERFLKTDEDVARYLSQPIELAPPDLSAFALAEARLAGGKGLPLIGVADPICIVAELFEFGEFMVRAFRQPEQIVTLLEHVAPAVYAHLDYLLAAGLRSGDPSLSLRAEAPSLHSGQALKAEGSGQALAQRPSPAGDIRLFRVVGAEYVTPPYLPPRLFERFVVRYTAPMIQRIHAHGAYARLHCHGRIRQVLPMIAEMGVDALDPVEAPPSGDITLAEVKRLYGDRLCLMGNLQLRDLETASAEEMAAIVQETLAAGMPGGGFVIMPTAAPINADLSPVTERNYRIFIETALEYGRLEI